MIVTCALSPFTSLAPYSVASAPASAPSTGKPTESTNSLSEKINKEIQRVKNLQKSLNDKQNGQNNPLTEEENKRLSDCNSKLSALQTAHKLAEFADQLDTHKNNHNNLLNNLCNGLEKFLGFNSVTKGYDGTGIVYSDLDRLCDGVMGFLSGVLSNIKDHLGQHKDALNDAINTLEQNKHAGKNGFNAAIDSVVRGVRGYNKEVKESNDEVKKIVTDLQNYIKTGGKLLNDIHNIQVTDEAIDKGFEGAKKRVEERLQECQREATKFTNALDVNSNKNENKDAINDLNDNVKQKLANVRSTVMYENERLQVVKAHAEGELAATIKQVGDALSTLKVSVDCNISEQVRSLVQELKTRVEKILQLLKTIHSMLIAYVQEVGQWITNAEPAVHAALEKVELIIREANAGDQSKQPAQIIAVADQLKVQADLLYASGTAAKERVIAEVKTALEAVRTMDGELKEDLGKVKKAVGDQVKEIKSKIGELGKIFADNAGQNAENIQGIVDRIRMNVNGITGWKGRDTPTAGLAVIRNKISGYVFDWQNFWGKVEKWLGDILQKDEVVKKYINAYVDTKNGDMRGKTPEMLRNAIMKHIKDELVGEISAASVSNTGNIQGSLVNVVKGINIFVEKLQMRFQHPGIGEVASKITAALLSKKSGDEFSGFADDTGNYLLPAIRMILHQLANVAMQTAYEIESFTMQKDNRGLPTFNIGEKVVETLEMADGLENKLRQALGRNGGRDRTNHAADVDNAITEVSSILEKGIGTTSIADDKISQLGEKGFDKYKQQVTQTDTLTMAEGDPNKLEGTLPAAIKKIRDHVNDALLNIDHHIGEAAMKLADVTNGISKLCGDITYASQTDPSSAKTKLLELKNTYFADSTTAKNSINKIHTQLSKLQKDQVANAIKAAQTLLGHAGPAGDATIRVLENHTGQQVEIAQQTLTTYARKQYVNLLKFALEKFAAKITTELQPLPNAISDDLEIGHQKFMNIFADTLLAKTKEIDAIDTTSSKKERHPLSKAADVCKDAVKGFLTKLHRHADFKSDVDKVFPSTSALRTLFSKLHHAKHFNKEFKENLESLGNELRRLNPKAYGEGKNPWLLESLKKGLSVLIEEFGKTYISTYSQETIDWEQATADEKLKYAKVLFTMTPFIYHELTELKEGLEKRNEKWNLYGIYNSSDPPSSLHALFFRENGYDADLPDDAAYGALNHRETLKGQNIYNHLINTKHTLLIASRSTDAASIKPGDDSGIQIEVVEGESVIDNLYSYSQYYFRVCHFTHITKPRTPSSVYEMLAWCSGLQFNPVYEPLCEYFKALFQKPEDCKYEPYKNIDPSKLSLVGTTTIQPSNLTSALRDVCANSYPVLTTILGNGHSGGKYACEFSNNSFNLQYPAVPEQCFDMLVDVLNRLYEQLYFLFKQCRNATELSGWYDCHYGRYVGGSDWRCNEKQCINQMVNQSADQKANQSCGQTCDQHSNCGLKSPLQSFLEDGLAGFLPHPYSKANCKLSCDMANHRGLPCKTPMGFGEISVKASHTQKGEHIAEALADFCGKQNSPLAQLCAQLTCLLQRVPQTLDDLFSFYYNILNGWNNDRIHKRMLHRENAFEAAVTGAYFGEEYPELDITPMFKSGEKTETPHSKGNVLCIVNCNNASPTATCGRYLLPLSANTWSVYSEKNADKYLSWIVYLTETFYQWLQQLYNECCNNCNKPGSRCFGTVCSKTCPVKSAYSSEEAATVLVGKKHTRDCKSIANCPSTRPTLCRYGFVFNSSSNLSDAKFDETKRTCNDLCQALQKVLSDKEADEAPLAVLIYKTIPQFLWDIRSKFFWLNVALWLLSFLYLLHIMVIRLDLLHIKSHLHSPSSHRIAAQSLLAAARVNKLNRVFYLQP